MARGAAERRFRGTVEYDGTDYGGFQIQSSVRTIQGELEAALARITQAHDGGRSIRVVGAGRTDAGVHAVGQVIHFDSRWPRSLGELGRALNALLPEDISVKGLAVAGAGFHSRHSATGRHYAYSVLNLETRSPTRERFAYRVAGRIDLAAMNEAAAGLIGTHDCAAFGQPSSGSVTLRTVYRALWTRDDAEVHFDISANGFLRKMVRRLVGTLLWVGQGEIGVSEFESILRGGDISRSAPPAPARGLCLMAVHYGDCG